ncbi:bifunctional DNA primase/polymerase [Mycobacteroides abscessus]|uniref:bifunctional DNA primase/polymerase n=1 Tax=Mycobacteroides abscessus TaxID=36809 RepID=UPI000C258333|nr:bifunctional DNA primase/polymerase [Mycobacteroides abscessus]
MSTTFDEFVAARPQLQLDTNPPVSGWCHCPDRYRVGTKPILIRHTVCDNEGFAYLAKGDRLMHAATLESLAAWIPVPPPAPAADPNVAVIVIDRMITLGFHLVRLHAGEKAPVGAGWNDPARTPALTRDEAIAHVQAGGGLGVLLGPSRLIVIDAENAAAVQALLAAGLRPVLFTAKGMCPVTCDPRVSKVGGGHVWLCVPEGVDVTKLDNVPQASVGEGGLVDVLVAPGSMAVVPPTALVEAGGWAYTADGSHPVWSDEGVATAPAWMFDASVPCPDPAVAALHGRLVPAVRADRGPVTEAQAELSSEIDQVSWEAVAALDARMESWGDVDPECGCEQGHWRDAEKRKSYTLHDCGRGSYIHIWSLTMRADLGLADGESTLSKMQLACRLQGRATTGADFRAVAQHFGIELHREQEFHTIDADDLEEAATAAEAAAAEGVTTVAVPTTGTPMPDGSHRGEIVQVEVGSDGLLRRAQRLRGAAAEVRAAQHPVAPRDGAVLLGADSVVGAPTVGANALQPMPEPEPTAEEQAAAEAEALADKRDPYRHLPDPCTEELEELVFGDPRLPQVGQIRTAARAAAMSPWSTLGLSIGRGLLRVRASVLVPDLVGGMPAPLNYQIGIVGASGRGKGAAHGLVIYDAGVLIHTEDSIDKKFMPPSGAALAGLFVARQKDDDGKVEVVPIREAAWCDWSEVDTLTAQSGRGGNDLASELRAAITGAELGTDPKKDGADPLKVEPLSYRILVSFSTQYGKPAMALMAERDGGTLQRTNWFSTSDPRSLSKRPRGPKPRAEIDIMRGLPTSHVVKHPDGDRELLTVDDAIHDEVWEAQANKIRFDRDVDELAGHQNLNRLRTAAWAALIQHQAHIGAFEWEWAGHVMEHSRRVRDRLEASVKGLKKEQAQENGSLDFDRKNAAELAKVAHTEALLTSLAKWGRDVREGRNKFGKSGPTFTLRDIQASAKNAKSERYTRAAELATELCMRQLWVCEGERMRSVEPDPE